MLLFIREMRVGWIMSLVDASWSMDANASSLGSLGVYLENNKETVIVMDSVKYYIHLSQLVKKSLRILLDFYLLEICSC